MANCPVSPEAGPERVEEVIQVKNRWYVLATAALSEDRPRVLKHGETFAVFDRMGNIRPYGLGEEGLYHGGTRFLSKWELTVNERQPMLLNSSVREDNSLLSVDLTTPDLYKNGRLLIARGTIYLSREQLLWEGVHYEHVRLVNYSEAPVSLNLEWQFAADFADIFEIRGVSREQRGTRLPARTKDAQVFLAYQGLDGVRRRTRLTFSPVPARLTKGQAAYHLKLPPGGQTDLYVTVACQVERQAPKILAFSEAAGQAEDALKTARTSGAKIYTSNEQFNDWLNRSVADLGMLMTQTPHGCYPYAGVPWFSTPFGRDGLITALEYLWVNPDLARGVLTFLAETQAQEENPEQDAEPGKILHEAREGEMAALGEVPFQRYYGSVDATPLFIVLAEAYFRRTGDRDFLAALWPHVLRALDWLDRYGDQDRDGFVEYQSHTPLGLQHQGWKDSDEAVFHADGRPVRGPIALCEVQGYVYLAKKSAAALALALGEPERARCLEKQATTLKRRFNRLFWCADLDTYALALDGDKQPCRVRASNAGHALWSGIASWEHAHRLVRTLFSEDFYSGWGIRTLARSEARYNPMSYHNGSVWPHDNALIAAGLARYGFKNQAIRILTGLFDASIVLDLHRLPELFCGFKRLAGQGPILYPVACAPQAWASAAVFCLLQAILGISFSPEKPQLYFNHPRLPEYLEWVEIHNLRVGQGSVDLILRRHPRDVGVNVLRKDKEVEIAVIL
ncbi:MAG: amylo-alpha-1,6-glucosidase [Deltaproteobacteria bacterium]|nr:amylo-alpha-1,6-glucosidase [Deltaproteobacteria bacterium]